MTTTFADIWKSFGSLPKDVHISTIPLTNKRTVMVNGLYLPSLNDEGLETTVGIVGGDYPSTDFPFFHTEDNFIKVFQRLGAALANPDNDRVSVGVWISATYGDVFTTRTLWGCDSEVYRICSFQDPVQTFMFELRRFRPTNKHGITNLSGLNYILNPATWENQGSGFSVAEDARAAQHIYEQYFGIKVEQPWDDSKVYSVR